MSLNFFAICALIVVSGCVSDSPENQQLSDITNQKQLAGITMLVPQSNVITNIKDGETDFVYPDGRLWVRCNYHAGVLNGAWNVFYPDGTVEETGNYLNGKKQEQWIWYYPDSKVYMRGYFAADARDSTWESFNSKGYLWWKGYFLQGQKHGMWEAWSGGVRVEEANFSHGYRQGTWHSFYSNGRIQLKGQFQRGIKIGLWQEYDQLGNKIRSVDMSHAESLEPLPYEQQDEQVLQAEHELRTRLEPTFQVDVAGPFLIASEAPKFKTDQIINYTILWLHEQMMRDFNRAQPVPMSKTIYLFLTTESYYDHTQRWFGKMPIGAAGFATENALMVDITTGTGTLVHELIHAYLHADISTISPWIDEGLASLYEQSIEVNGEIRGLVNWRLPMLKKAIKEKQIISLNELTALNKSAFSGNNVGLHYAEARYLCYYLQDIGVLRKFYHAYRDNYQTDPHGVRALMQVLRKSNLQEIQIDWLGFMEDVGNNIGE